MTRKILKNYTVIKNNTQFKNIMHKISVLSYKSFDDTYRTSILTVSICLKLFSNNLQS